MSRGLDSVAVTRFFAGLRQRDSSASTVHQAYRSLKTFCRACIAVGALTSNPLAGLGIRTPKTLPQVPTEHELRTVLGCCGGHLKAAEIECWFWRPLTPVFGQLSLVRLIVENWNPSERGLCVLSKGGKDRIVFLSPITTRALREYLEARRTWQAEDYLFATRDGRALTPRHLVQILHRLSARAGLADHRRLHPHALRHLAATTWLRHGMGLAEVRRLLGHASLQTTLRYSSLVSADVQRAHRRAAAIERMRLE